ncbi:MAG TPA: type IV pilus secretin PilQ, partial [Desulfuromonadales bacterium]|nr:type IV pilus secretin PilQ [Desulfuromonadales bacterium]
FPGLDASGVTPPAAVPAPLKAIAVTPLKLSTGSLGRVELVLKKTANYTVSLSGNDFFVKFGAVAKQASAPQPATVLPAQPAASAPAASPQTQVKPAVATLAEGVQLASGRAVLKTNGKIAKYRYFSLTNPPRLVVDLYQIRPGFSQRRFDGVDGIQRVRVSSSKVKTRFVFDIDGATLPEYVVKELASSIVVTWEHPASEKQADVAMSSSANASKVTSASAVSVKSLDFNVVGTQSVLTVALSGHADLIPVTTKGHVVTFGIKNAKIRRALRRTIDSSAFPSSVRLITPYSVRDGATQDVKFAVQLKGSVPYTLQQAENRLTFSIENGKFAQQGKPGRVEQVKIPVPATKSQAPQPAKTKPAAPAPAAKPASAQHRTVAGAVSLTGAAAPKVYTGKKISLVFDDANLRKIFQLIADVSNLNIIVSDDVKGTISLRLIDVPWDQALDLILETKNLGMLQEGNVVQILPKDKIRAMQEASLTANRTKEKLEDLDTEVIPVSYTDLKNIDGPAKELLSARGKITPDARNKQIIVTDVPGRIAQIKKLVSILDTPERQVLIEARIVYATSDFERQLGVSWGLSRKSSTSTSFWNPSLGNLTSGNTFTVTDGSVANQGIGMGLEFGGVKLNGTQLDLALQASDVLGDTKTISKPRVTTLNGEKATISEGQQIPYQTVSNNGTQTQFVNANLELQVTPIINPDNTIFLTINATNNSVAATLPAGGTAPSINTQEGKTKVLVKNGQTTVIGGIFTENNTNTESGIPGLARIPFLGHLFKSTDKKKGRTELLIFVTPWIVND